jgi:hypothetical protein
MDLKKKKKSFYIAFSKRSDLKNQCKIQNPGKMSKAVLNLCTAKKPYRVLSLERFHFDLDYRLSKCRQFQ